MTTYEFTLVLQGSPELTDQVADQLFEAGCDDGTPATRGGVFSIDFHRAARTLVEAIGSAVANVKSAGLTVERIEIEAGALPVPA